MSINNIELDDINPVLDDTKEINKIEEIQEIDHDEIKKLSGKSVKKNNNFKANLFLKETFAEIEFKKFFKIKTSDIEFKDGLFYKKVKILLESNSLIVFEKISEENPQIILFPLLVLNFDQITAEISIVPESHKFKIYVLGSKRIFNFRADNAEIYNNILYYLNFFINSSIGSRTNLLGVSLRKDFYKFYFYTEKQFSENANTGDLLIFRGFEFASRCQRSFTCAHYDHVALLVKKNDQLYIYESTSKDGAMLRNWRDFLFYYWVLLYDKMVYRELIYNTTDEEKAETQEKLKESCEIFIKDTQKKKYIFSCCSLCCAKRKDYENKNEWSKSKGFFCSQLVAAAYSYCGILKNNKSTKKYLPGSFSSMSNYLELNEKYSLGPEIIIDFTLHN